MALTLAGVLWVVVERPATDMPRGHRVQGVLLGVLYAFCQAVGLVMAKKGMGDGIDPLTATTFRMAAATFGIWVVALSTRRLGSARLVWTDRVARYSAIGATLVGPTFGVLLSLVAARHTSAGIAATLMATVPVLVLPLVIFVRKERVSPRAALGAVVAVAGVALIYLR
jgi:drug/metabolite transporter (DMT)-like permease